VRPQTAEEELRVGRAALAFVERHPALSATIKTRNLDEALFELEFTIGAMIKLPAHGVPNCNTGVRLERLWNECVDNILVRMRRKERS
jgi:hypothetical protein